ncbi:hypothetical protein V5O48_002895 [Marasmius crinis-equi]|uniref:DUF6697 domain-containing protein n=1 Tax=Marasmius crinis-equi TaxID=585013 RepID=A0ABR3FUF3_9AGAR
MESENPNEYDSWCTVYHKQLVQTILSTSTGDPPNAQSGTSVNENQSLESPSTATATATSSASAKAPPRAGQNQQPILKEEDSEDAAVLGSRKVLEIFSRLEALESERSEWQSMVVKYDEKIQRLEKMNSDLVTQVAEIERERQAQKDANQTPSTGKDANIIELSSDSDTEPHIHRPARRKRKAPAPTLQLGSPLPVERANALPPPIADLKTGERRFTRDELSKKLGGSVQGTLTKISKSQKPIAKEFEMNAYMCPNVSQNPWCPKAPGEHGYVFVGLGVDKKTFLKEERQHVFIGEKGRDKLAMRYVGYYSCERVDPLTKEEWDTLPRKVHHGYSKLSKEKNKDERAVEDVRKDYDQGNLRVPCVKLTCLEYDHRLFEGLVSSEMTSTSVGQEPASGTGPSKRARRAKKNTSYRETDDIDDIYSSDLCADVESDLDADYPGPQSKRQRCSY